MENSVVTDILREISQTVFDNFIGLAVVSPLVLFAYFSPYL
jgi:hypothetical protein